MPRTSKLRASTAEPETLDASVRNSSLVSASQRHEVRSSVGFVGTLTSFFIALLLAAGVAGSGYMAVKSVWNFIHLPENIKLPSITLPHLPRVSMPHIQLPQWLTDRLPHGAATPGTSGASAPEPSATTSPSPTTQLGSTAAREQAFITAIRSAVQTGFDDAALLDLGRSGCTVLAQGGDTQSLTSQVDSDAAQLAGDLGVSLDDAQAVAQVVAMKVASTGLCGN